MAKKMPILQWNVSHFLSLVQLSIIFGFINWFILFHVAALLVGHQTSEGQSSKSKYRPLFLDHFEKKEQGSSEPPAQISPSSTVPAQPIPMTPEEQKRFESNLQRQLNQISAGI